MLALRGRLIPVGSAVALEMTQHSDGSSDGMFSVVGLIHRRMNRDYRLWAVWMLELWAQTRGARSGAGAGLPPRPLAGDGKQWTA